MSRSTLRRWVFEVTVTIVSDLREWRSFVKWGYSPHTDEKQDWCPPKGTPRLSFRSMSVLSDHALFSSASAVCYGSLGYVEDQENIVCPSKVRRIGRGGLWRAKPYDLRNQWRDAKSWRTGEAWYSATATSMIKDGRAAVSQVMFMIRVIIWSTSLSPILERHRDAITTWEINKFATDEIVESVQIVVIVASRTAFEQSQRREFDKQSDYLPKDPNIQ